MVFRTVDYDVLQLICNDNKALDQICNELEDTNAKTTRYCPGESDRRIYDTTFHSDGHDQAVMFRAIIESYKKNKERFPSAN